MYKLSPSDFAYLYEECKLCYCLKIKEGIYQPSMPMPGVFSAMNSIVQGSLVGKNLRTLSTDLPNGEVVKQEGWVNSIIIPETQCYIKGKYDLLVKNPDGTYSLVDLKISKPDEGKAEKYKTQLSAYKFALENPKHGEPIKISQLALLVFYPKKVSFEMGIAKLDFPPKWIEIPDDQKYFLNFTKKVDELLSNPLPKESKTCKWCQYRHLGEKFSHRQKTENNNDSPF